MPSNVGWGGANADGCFIQFTVAIKHHDWQCGDLPKHITATYLGCSDLYSDTSRIIDDRGVVGAPYHPLSTSLKTFDQPRAFHDFGDAEPVDGVPSHTSNIYKFNRHHILKRRLGVWCAVVRTDTSGNWPSENCHFWGVGVIAIICMYRPGNIAQRA